jgi:hypothetical protein
VNTRPIVAAAGVGSARATVAVPAQLLWLALRHALPR